MCKAFYQEMQGALEMKKVINLVLVVRELHVMRLDSYRGVERL